MGKAKKVGDGEGAKVVMAPGLPGAMVCAAGNGNGRWVGDDMGAELPWSKALERGPLVGVKTKSDASTGAIVGDKVQ